MDASDNLRITITNLREQHNWSQAELARRVGLDSSYLSRIESGNRKVSSNELDKFAQVFGVSTDFLLGRPSTNQKSLSEEDLEKAVDTAHAFSGKPISDHDRKVIKGILASYFS